MNESSPIGIAMILCESSTRDTDGAVSLGRILNRVKVESFPFRLPRMSIYFAFSQAHPDERLALAVVDASSEEVLLQLQVELPSADAIADATVIELDIGIEPFPVEFQGPGAYAIRLYARERVILERTLHLESADVPSRFRPEAVGPPRLVTDRNIAAIEMALLDSFGATDNKLRWITMIDTTEFRLYIPKWRVPEPWPKQVAVTVEPVPKGVVHVSDVTPEAAANDGAVRPSPIRIIVDRIAWMTKTVRYRPQGNAKAWELGEPYIPIDLTHDGADQLLITVKWDLQSRGKFND